MSGDRNNILGNVFHYIADIIDIVDFQPKSRAVCQRGGVEVVLADAQRLPQGRMEHVKVDQDPSAVLLELLMPRGHLVLPEVQS